GCARSCRTRHPRRSGHSRRQTHRTVLPVLGAGRSACQHLGFASAAEFGSGERVFSHCRSARASAHPTGAEAVRHRADGGVGDTAFPAEEPAGGANASGPAAAGGPGPAGAEEGDETLTQLPSPSGLRRAAAFADQTQSAPAPSRMTAADRDSACPAQAESRLSSHCGCGPVTGSMPESTMGTMTANAILSDLIQRPAQAAEALPALSPDQLNTHLGGHPNSIAWLLWHSRSEERRVGRG